MPKSGDIGYNYFMKSYFGPDTIQKTLRLAALYNIVWGLLVVFFPVKMFHLLSMQTPLYVELWQCIGMMAAVYGLGYFIASSEPETHWPIVLLGFITKIFVALGFLKAYLAGTIPVGGFCFIVFSDLIWIIPFYYTLIYAYEANTKDESAPKRFNDLIKVVRTNNGETLYDLSEKKNVLLVFIRHFGCPFCRETVSEIAKFDESIRGKNLTPVFIHMSDPDFANDFFGRYYNHPVAHVSDPGRTLYKSLNLKRGSLNQIFGPKIWVRGCWAGLFKGHGMGASEGDVLQLGGYFILSHGQIVFEQKTKAAADFFKLEVLPKA
jgi:hypothetical protein